MLKTNSKKVRETVKNYIIESFHSSDFESWHETEITDYKTICNCILSAFWLEKVQLDKRRMSEKALFFEWCQGLPNVLDCDYYLASAKDLLAEWLEETEEEKEKYTEEQAENLITTLLYRELTTTGKVLPKIKKEDFKKLCGDFATYKPYGRSIAFECPEIGSDKYSTTLFLEDVHFIITLK